ncbi:MAG: hypothetical protein RL701_1820 [Pseudomonadota bacterium]
MAIDRLKQQLSAAWKRACRAWRPGYDSDLRLVLQRQLDGVEPAPPWVAYRGSSPEWGGWRQGVSEAWLHDVWLPFWRGLSADQGEQYVQRWSADDEWLERLKTCR